MQGTKRLLFVTLCILVPLALGRVSFHSQLCAFLSDEANCVNKGDWVQQRRAHKNDLHTVVIAVKKPTEALSACDSELEAISNPKSPRYGQFYSLEELRTLPLFDGEATTKVQHWLNKKGLDFETSANGDFIRVTAKVDKLEDLLDTKFYVFYSAGAAKRILRTPEFSLPKKVASHIDFVGYTTTFPEVKLKVRSFLKSQADGNVTPSLISQVYGVPTTLVTNVNATQSVFEALGQDFSQDDLAAFQQQFNVYQNPVSNVIGPNDASQCQSNPDSCGEANLDVQYIMGIAQNATTTYWSIDENSQDPFLDWIVALSSDPSPPLVHSISYGSISTENPEQDMFRFNTEVCQLGLRGLSVIVSSGDDGVANFEARNNASDCGFHPSFPATSPYVTSVGATQGPESNQPEVACTSDTGGLITTGGGFSIYFSRPSYQDAVVTSYLQNGPNVPPTNLYNSNGRAYPDVSMMGHNYNVVIGGSTYIESGTSASAPVFAAVITLINNARLNAGKSPLGFLNYAIYQLGTSSTGIFNDITSGTNNCCAGNPGQQICCQYGFTATTGWDPLTGFGSVNYVPLLKAFLMN